MCLCDIFLKFEEKKTIKKFIQIKETLLRPYSNAQICLIQRHFFLIKETFFWVNAYVKKTFEFIFIENCLSSESLSKGLSDS